MTMPSRHSFVIAPLALATFVAVGCATSTANSGATADHTVSSVDTPRSSAAVLLDPTNPEWRRAAPARSHLRFETTRGVFVLELVRAWVPSAWKDQQIANDSPRSHNVRGTFAFAQFGPVDS